MKVAAGSAVRREAENVIIPEVAISIGGTDTPAELAVSTKTGTINISAAVPSPFMSASLRYFTGGPAGLSAFCYPVFDGTATKKIGIVGKFHPSRPGDPASGFSVVDDGSALPTAFRSTLGQVITLAPIAGVSQIAYQWDPEIQQFYAVPKGDWRLGVERGPIASESVDVLLGLSGIEFGRIGANGKLRFVSGAPAYVPGYGLTGASASKSLTSSCPGSQYDVTTAWVYPVGDGTGPQGSYYSQPAEAGLYTPEATGNFLDVLSLAVANFPPPADLTPGGATGVMGAPEASFPMVPYAGVQVATILDGAKRYRAFETEVLATNRFSAITEMARNSGSVGSILLGSLAGPTYPSGPTGPSGPFVNAVTPSGLLSTFSKDLREWDSMILARSSSATGNPQELQLTGFDSVMKAAMLGSQLFLVVSDPDALMEHASIRYQVTQQVEDYFTASGASRQILDGLAELKANGIYATMAYFQPDAELAFGANYTEPSKVDNLTWGELLLREAALALLTISGWSFDVSPARWRDESGASTIMILKFADGDLEALIDDLSAWTMPRVFNADPVSTQANLRQIIADAKNASQGGEREFDYFVHTVVQGGKDDSTPWNGSLFLDVYVPTSEFPPQLEGLAAGIKSANFRAHHLGINLSPVNIVERSFRMNDSAVFGLIYYQDSDDLVFNGDAYDYKVLSLRVLFQNSEIASFTSQIELLITALFGEKATLVGGQSGNNIKLNGNWQKQGTHDSYTFSQEGESLFEMESQVLSSVLITKGQFVTELPKTGAASGGGSSRFLLWGALRYRKLAPFDLFSFGPDADPAQGTQSQLAFSNMFISLTYNRETRADRKFAFEAGQMAFDPASSLARAQSLYQRFPLSVTRMVQGAPLVMAGPTGVSGPPSPQTPPKSPKPADLGFINITSPLTAGSLGEEWYGLEMEINLGTRGALSGQAVITASLLAAWAPSKTSYNVAMGMRLPGSDGKSLNIAGPLKLNIGSIEMMLSQPDQSYLMRFRNIALGFLGLKFPPGGQTNVLLFGDPNPQSNNASLGWYAAYKKDEEKKDSKGDSETLVILDDAVSSPTDVERSDTWPTR